MKRILTMVILFLCSFASAQQPVGTTLVTATVTDAHGMTYAGGTFSAKLATPAGTLLNPATGTLNSSGTFSVSLKPDSWIFTICAKDNITCFTSTQTISGTTQSLTTALSAAAPPYYTFQTDALKVGVGGVTFPDGTQQATATLGTGSAVDSVNGQTGAVVISTITGNSGTATALAANGANCSAGQAPLGVDAAGAVEGCFTPAGSGSGDASTNTATSVDSEIALFSSTTGKIFKRATTTGILKGTSGVLSAATAGTDYVSPTGTETLTNKTLSSPFIGIFTNAGHTHQDTAGGGTLSAAAIASGLLAVARGGTGTATPGIVAGTNVTVSGTWPNQTVNSTSGGGGDASTNTASSVDSEIALFSSTTGKIFKRATTTGLLKATSGVLSAATSGTDYVVPAGNVATATALAANPSNCSVGQAAGGVNASGVAEDCFTPSGSGDASTNTASSVDSEAAIFSSTTGKILKRSTLTGIIKQTSGVQSVATSGTDYVVPGGNVATATALAADGANCSAGQAPLGVDASGAVQSCFTPSGGSTINATDATIPKRLNSGAFTNSAISDNGTTVTSSEPVSAPSYTASGLNAGIEFVEGTGAGVTPAAGVDATWGSTTTHRLMMNNNNGSNLMIAGVGTAGTSGNRVVFAANGIDLADGGAPSSGTVNAGATNILPKYTSSTTVDDSLFSDDGTTGTYTGTGGLAAPSFIGTGSGTAGYIKWTQGTKPSAGTTAITMYAPTSVTSYFLALPGAAATGLMHWSNSAGTVTSSISGVAIADHTATGTPSSTTFLRGDNTWATPAGSGTVTATAGALTSNALMLGAGTTDSKVMASLGTTTTLLHGNAAGAPTFAAASLTADVSGILPVANGGTNNAFFTVAGPASSAKTYTFPNANATMTQTIASGAKALATSAIGSAACSSAQTDTATGTATTDTVQATFNGDPTAVTGYVPLTTGMLTIIVYPTTDTVNFKVCNNTSASITPGAITLNWKVTR